LKPRSAEAFILRTSRLGESDVLVSLFTEEEGKLRGVARGARRSRRRFAGALEPLTRVRVSFVEREGRDLARIDDLEVRQSFFQAQAEPAVAAACGYVVEVVDQFAREKEPDERFFRLVGTVLDGLSRGVDPRLAARYFEVWTLRLQGLLPDLRACSSCGQSFSGAARFEPRLGELQCARCAAEGAGATRVARGALVLAGTILTEPLLAVAERGVDRDELLKLARLLTAILARFVERPFRSARLLEEFTE